MRTALLLLVAVCSVTPAAAGALNCSFPSAPRHLPLPRCPLVAQGSFTVEDAARLAPRVAPILYMHPLEPYKLQSPKAFFDNAGIFYQDSLNSSDTRYQFLAGIPAADPLTLLWGSRQFATILNSTKVSAQERDSLLAGAAVDEEGLSTAPVYYTAYDAGPDAMVFNYNFFYSFNGCSQQSFALAVNGSAEVLDMRGCPFGTHEGDWERVSVLACKSDGAIKQVSYSQHAWTEVLDCERGECPMEDGHPVTHAALETHGNYPAASPYVVYNILSASLQNVTLVNLGGLFLGDRTKKDPRVRFVPREDNIIRIPPLETILEQNLTEWAWALFGGVWGGPLEPSAPFIQCYFDNQTRLDTCPPSPALSAYNFGMQFFKSFFGGNGPERNAWVVAPPSNSSYYLDGSQGTGILGPLARTYSYIWMPELGAPLYSNPNQPLVCPGELPAEVPFRAKRQRASIHTIVLYLAGISGGCALFAMLMTALLSLPALLDKQSGTRRLAVTQLRQGLWRRAASRLASMSRKGSSFKGRSAAEGGCPGGKGQESDGEGAAAGSSEGGAPRAARQLAFQGEGLEGKKDWPAAGTASVFQLQVDATGGVLPALPALRLPEQGLSPAMHHHQQQQELSAAMHHHQQQQELSAAMHQQQQELSAAVYQQQQQQRGEWQGVASPRGSPRATPSQPSSPTMSSLAFQGVRTSEQELLPLQRGGSLLGHKSHLQRSASVGAAAAAAALGSPRLQGGSPRGSALGTTAVPSSKPGRPSLLWRPGCSRQQQADAADPQQQQQQQQQAFQEDWASVRSPGPSPIAGHALWPGGDQCSPAPFPSPLQGSCCTPPAASPSLLWRSPASQLCPASPGPELTAVVKPQGAMGCQHMVWAGLALCLYFAAIGMLGHSTAELYSLAKAVEAYVGAFRQVMKVLKIIVATGLALTGLCDIAICLFCFLALPRARKAWGGGSRRGFWGWVQYNSHGVHVVMAGLVVVVISLSMILFGIGLLALMTQLAMQLACAAASRITLITGNIPLESLCVSLPDGLALAIPGLGGDVTVLCIWELINTCFYLSNFLVWDLAVGSALLLFSHVLFLVLVNTSLVLNFQFTLSLRSSDLRAAHAATKDTA